MYFAVCDRLIGELSERFEDFNNFVQKFYCLLPANKGNMEAFEKLSNHYAIDLDVESAVVEYANYTVLLESSDDFNSELSGSSVQELLLFFKKHGLVHAYPNMTILLRILGTLSVSTAGAERSFSKLKLIKTYLRSTMGEERLSGLPLISIERGLADSLDFGNVLNRFSKVKILIVCNIEVDIHIYLIYLPSCPS